MSGPITADGFTATVAAALGALDGVTVTALRSLALRVETDDRVGTLDLTWAWRDVQRDPAALDDVVASAVEALPEATHTERLDPAQVLPMLRTIEDLARLSTGRGGAAHPRSRPFAGELLLGLVHDQGGSVRVLSALDTDRLGLADPALWDLARRNLARLPLQVEGALPVLQVLAGGTFDATCLWHPGLTDRLPAGCLAAAPARGVLLLAPAPDAAARAELADLAREVHATRAHRLSPDLLAWDGATWAAAT